MLEGEAAPHGSVGERETGRARLPPADGGAAPADDDRRRQRSAGLSDDGLAGAQPRRRRAFVADDARARDQGGSQARLSADAGAAARRLRSAATTIGFVCDEFSTDPWTAIGLDGVREKAWAHGLTVTVMATRGDADMEAAALAQLAALPLAGLVYATINTRLVEAPSWPPPAPLVLLNCHAANGGAGLGRAGRGRRRARRDQRADRAGHKRIGYVNGEASMEAARHRLRGYRQALATADLPFDPDLVREGNWQPLSGYEATRALMALNAPSDRDLLRQRPDGARLLRGAARTRPEDTRRRRGDGLRRPRDRRATASAADHRLFCPISRWARSPPNG